MVLNRKKKKMGKKERKELTENEMKKKTANRNRPTRDPDNRILIK